jgi:hypothetical protein
MQSVNPKISRKMKKLIYQQILIFCNVVLIPFLSIGQSLSLNDFVMFSGNGNNGSIPAGSA